jgi:molecular chaperone GrpE (heat shock protein)
MHGKKVRKKLWDIHAKRVDLVDAPANRKRLLVIKSKLEPLAPTNGDPQTPNGREDYPTYDVGWTPAKKGATMALSREQQAAILREVGEKAMSCAAGLLDNSLNDVQAKAELGGLVDLLENAVDSDPDPTTSEELSGTTDLARSTATTAAEMAELLKLAEQLKQGGDSEAIKGGLDQMITALKAMSEQYPSPKSGEAKSAGDSDHTKVMKSLLQTSEQLLQLAQQLGGRPVINQDLTGNVEHVAKAALDALEVLHVTKAEVTAPAALLADSVSNASLVESTTSLLKEAGMHLAYGAGIGMNQITDVAKAELGYAAGQLHLLQEKLPMQIAKSAQQFSASLSDLAERALNLSETARKADNTELQTGLQGVANTLQEVLGHYAEGIKKATEVSLADMSTILGVSQQLQAFEDQLKKVGIVAPEQTKEQDIPASPQVAGKEQVAKADDATATDQGCDAGAKPESKATEKTPEELKKEEEEAAKKKAEEEARQQTQKSAQVALSDLEAQVAKLREDNELLRQQIAKARNDLPLPGSIDPRGDADKQPLFPENYNDPTYRDAE